MMRTILFIVYDIVSHTERKINYLIFIFYFIETATCSIVNCKIALQKCKKKYCVFYEKVIWSTIFLTVFTEAGQGWMLKKKNLS